MLSPERWQIAERIFHETLQHPPAERRAFIASSCGGDEEVRLEVESLLAADSSHDTSAAVLKGVVSDWASDTAPGTMAGREIGGYRVVSLLGEGGMGEVYLADDLSLGRRVAVKLLPLRFTSDAGRLHRFTEEARAASALNHPNIITVHQIGEFDRRRYIVTEFVDGETLRSRIDRGPLTEAEAVKIAAQAARALRAAHDAGIVHRDIKPENLMIRRDGYVKVLDFGLAKLLPGEQLGESALPGSEPRTRAGAVLGTPDYMAPEQARGGVVDARADIFSLAVVLHEMVTGVLPVESGGHSRDEREAGPRPGPGLARILGRGLAEDPVARYPRIEDMLDDLEALGARGENWRTRLRRHRRALAAAACALLAVIAGWGAWQRVGRGPLVSSLAVLPLTNVSGDPNLDYLGEGIAEGVLNRLAQLPNLKVIARSTAFQFKGREGRPAEVGRELKVDAVLTGRLMPQRDGAEVEVNLVGVHSGEVLWSQRFASRLEAGGALDEEIARRVTERLRLPSGAAEAPMDPGARNLYLKGRYQLNKRTPEGLRQARGLFDQALERDPDHPLLHAGLAETWALIGAYGVLPPADTFPKAIAAARQALERDENLAEARTTLALCLFLFEWRWAAAEAEFRRAAGTRPGYARAHHWYGEFLMARGRTEEAVAALSRAKELDPLSPVIAVDEGRAYYFGHQFQKARERCQRALDAAPDFVPAIDCLAMVATEEGRYDESIAYYIEVSRLWGSDSGLPGRAMATARAGRSAEAKRLWLQLSARERPGYTQPLSLALVQASLGNRDEAFRLIDVARLARANNIPYLKTDPRVKSLRNDPRWADFALQAGLE
ncbi:MAG TPA: protein kinase [Vicinamibacteria bacterium]|nr:protein kinase [Vicinamibacteria bacterium]